MHFGQKLYISRAVKTISIKSCNDKNNLFYLDEPNAATRTNCHWGRQIGDLLYCLQCKFAFQGELKLTTNNLIFRQNCKADSKCYEKRQYIIKDQNIRQFISCHECTESALLPTIDLYPVNYGNLEDLSYQLIYPDLSINSVELQTYFSSNCRSKEAQQINKCMIQMDVRTNAVPSGANINNLNYVCVQCKPKYKPTYLTVTSFPFEIVTACTEIFNCAQSWIAGECEQCDEGYVLLSDKITCQQQTDPNFKLCNKQDTDPTTNTVICTECKNQAIMLLQCIPYNVTNCAYFETSKCVQSTKTMGINYNMIVRRTFDQYYIKQISCNSIAEVEGATIVGCMHYASKTKCYICWPTYYLGNSGQLCFKKEVGNCVSYDTHGKCQECTT